MTEVISKIPARIKNAAVGGHVCGTEDIIDDNKNKTQEQINEEFDGRIGEGSIESRIAQAVNDEKVRAEAVEQSHDSRLNNVETKLGNGGTVDERIALEGAKHYLKNETYTKDEVNGLITTPDQNYVTVEATSQTTAATDVLPATGAADTIYRVGSWNGTQYDATTYTEYSWNATENVYVKLDTKQTGIDNEPTKNSQKVVKSGGIVDMYGEYDTDYNFVKKIKDNGGKNLVRIGKDDLFVGNIPVLRSLKSLNVDIEDIKASIDETVKSFPATEHSALKAALQDATNHFAITNLTQGQKIEITSIPTGKTYNLEAVGSVVNPNEILSLSNTVSKISGSESSVQHTDVFSVVSSGTAAFISSKGSIGIIKIAIYNSDDTLDEEFDFSTLPSALFNDISTSDDWIEELGAYKYIKSISGVFDVNNTPLHNSTRLQFHILAGNVSFKAGENYLNIKCSPRKQKTLKFDRSVDSTVIINIDNTNISQLNTLLETAISEATGNVNIVVNFKKDNYNQKDIITTSDTVIKFVNIAKPGLTISIVGNGSSMLCNGTLFNKDKEGTTIVGSRYKIPFVDDNGDPITFNPCHDMYVNTYANNVINPDDETFDYFNQEEFEFCANNITLYDSTNLICRLSTKKYPNKPESECNDLYIHITAQWMSRNCKVKKIENNYIYFYINSMDEFTSSYTGVNGDTMYGFKPRYKLINYKDNENNVAIENGYIYIPTTIGSIYVSKQTKLFAAITCNLNGIVISGFKFIGYGTDGVIGFSTNVFTEGVLINNCEFVRCLDYCVSAYRDNDIKILNNKFKYCDFNMIHCEGTNIEASYNEVNDYGYQHQNSCALRLYGVNFYASYNKFKNFGYAVIGTGVSHTGQHGVEHYGIFEYNECWFDDDLYNSYWKHSLIDGGCFYLAMTNNVHVRYNIIRNIGGLSAYHGLYLDDGSCCISMYSNLIYSNDISLSINSRYVGLNGAESDNWPDKNRWNHVLYNIISNDYRLDGNYNEKINVKGRNILLLPNRSSISLSTHNCILEDDYTVNNVVLNGKGIEVGSKQKSVLNAIADIPQAIKKYIHQ